MGALNEYRESVERGRAWFAANHASVHTAFEVLNTGFDQLAGCLQSGRDADDDTHVSLAPLLMISQRQALVALDALEARQAYQAWVLVRPGLEAGLMIGKWMEDVANYVIWRDRKLNWKAYQRAYSGSALASETLPRSPELQRALASINDSFVHPNPDYYGRHLRVSDVGGGMVEVKLQFFDDDSFHWASILGMLHLLILLQDSLARLFASKFVNLEVRPERFGLADFEAKHAAAAILAADAGPVEHVIVHSIGLWSTQ